jgi:hypothetical protein
MLQAQSYSTKSLSVYFMDVDFVLWKRSVRLQDLDFDENNSKSYKEKVKRPLVPLFI